MLFQGIHYYRIAPFLLSSGSSKTDVDALGDHCFEFSADGQSCLFARTSPDNEHCFCRQHVKHLQTLVGQWGLFSFGEAPCLLEFI